MFRVMCTACGAKTVEESFLLAKSQAEFHARETGHWGRVIFWRVGGAVSQTGPVRVVNRWGSTRFLGRVRAGREKIA